MFDGIKLIRRKYISISEVISLSYTSSDFVCLCRSELCICYKEVTENFILLLTENKMLQHCIILEMLL